MVKEWNKRQAAKKQQTERSKKKIKIKIKDENEIKEYKNVWYVKEYIYLWYCII